MPTSAITWAIPLRDDIAFDWKTQLNIAAGSGSKLLMYSGTRPASGGTAAGTLLCTLTAGNPFIASQSGGVLTLTTVPPEIASAGNSTACTWIRHTKSTGVYLADYSVPADLQMDNVNVTAGSTMAPGTITLAIQAHDSDVVNGWTEYTVGGRLIMYKAPAGGVWTKGVIVLLHGGGGSAAEYAVLGLAYTTPQVAFTTAALAAGYGVILLNSTDKVTDSLNRLVGKAWDNDTGAWVYNSRVNLDFSFIGTILNTTIGQLRPGGSSTKIFMVGHSSGALMTVHAMTQYGHLLTAAVLVSPHDPFGSHRVAVPTGSRPSVFGIVVDNATGLEIGEAGSGGAPTYTGEQTWPTPTAFPPYLLCGNQSDGIVDTSSHIKINAALISEGYPNTLEYITTDGAKDDLYHLWLDRYNTPIIAYLDTK
jgi:predicted esterase